MAGCNGDILLSLQLVGDDAAGDRASGIEAVERLAVTRIEREKIAEQVAGEKHIARSRRQRRVHRRRRMHAPAHLAGRRIDGVDPARPLVPRVVRAPAVREAGIGNRRDPLRLRTELEHGAPVDRIDVEETRLDAVGRAVPLDARDRADAHTFGRDRRVLVQHRRHRQLPDELAGVAIDHVQDAFLAAGRDQLAIARVEQRDGRVVPVVVVVRPQLVPPLELAGASIDRNRRDREQVRALAHVLVVIRPGIADRYEQRTRLAIERIRGPRGAAAVVGRRRGIPGIGAGLVAGGDEIEAPCERAVGDVERHHPALDAPIAARLRHVDEIVPHGGCGADAFTDAPVGDLPHPQRLAGLGVERVQEPVLRPANDSSACDRDPLVRRIHLRTLRIVLMRPQLSAGRRIDRIRAKVRGRVEDPVVDDRTRRERAELAQLEHAHRPQRAGVGSVDLVERRVAFGAIALVVHQPVRRRAVGSVELGLRRLVRRRLREFAVERPDLYRRRTGAHRNAARRQRVELEHAFHRRVRRELVGSGGHAALRQDVGDDIGIDLPVERAALSQRHAVVDVSEELLQRLAMPLRNERRTLERRRAPALELRAVAHRALLSELVAPLPDLRRAEVGRAVSEHGLRRRRGDERREPRTGHHVQS